MISFIKSHKLALLLLLILVFVLVGKSTSNRAAFQSAGTTSLLKSAPMPISGGGVPAAEDVSNSMPVDYTPSTDATNRMVISESNLALLVKNVVETRDKIIEYVQNNGGYMVSSQVSNPQDAPTATVIVRVPSKALETTLNFFRSQSIKVVSEYLSGYDVTDQYVDVEKRIALLEKTKTKIEEILASAREISDITKLSKEIINIQSQIDSMKGQQLALTKNAELAKMTIYLSTDEIALPYAPSDTFRPTVIFKQAVRSMVGILRVIAIAVIWLIVFAVVWVPALFIVRFIYRKMKK